MVKLDLFNVEEAIFRDRSLRDLLPEFTHLFDQYYLSVRVPALRQLGKRSMLDFLAQVQPDHLAKIGLHRGEEFSKEDHDFEIVRTGSIPVDNPCDSLCEMRSLPNFCLARDANEIQILYWR